MGFFKRCFIGHSDKTAQSPFFNQRVIFELVELLFGKVFETAVGPSAALTEIGLLKAVVEGGGNGKEGSKQERRQSDSENGNNIPGFRGFEGFSAQMADPFAVGYFNHALTPV